MGFEFQLKKLWFFIKPDLSEKVDSFEKIVESLKLVLVGLYWGQILDFTRISFFLEVVWYHSLSLI